MIVTEWYHEPVDYVVAKGLMDGVGNGKFDPNGQTTRAMIWTILARMSGVDTTPEEGDIWYAKALEWAIENGISDGHCQLRAECVPTGLTYPRKNGFMSGK